MRGLVVGLLMISVVACTEPRLPARAHAVTPPSILAVEVIDTLTTGRSEVLAKPIWIARDARGGYTVVDESDKDLKIFDSSGTHRGAIGAPGYGDGQFVQLIAGGIFRDSAYGYDFVTRKVSLFGQFGALAREFRIGGPPVHPMPAHVQAVDDSLFLVTGFTVGAEKQDLLALIRADGSVKSTFFRQRGPYSTTPSPALLRLTHTIADARDGIVYVGIEGSDSLFAFDYEGRELAAGVIGTANGRTLADFRMLLAHNGGEGRRADGSLVIEGSTALAKIIAIDRRHAILAIKELHLSGVSYDGTSPGVLVVAVRDEGGSQLRTEAQARIDQGLLGRDAQGNALALRYLGEDGTAVEVARIRLTTTSSPARRH